MIQFKPGDEYIESKNNAIWIWIRDAEGYWSRSDNPYGKVDDDTIQKILERPSLENCIMRGDEVVIYGL